MPHKTLTDYNPRVSPSPSLLEFRDTLTISLHHFIMKKYLIASAAAAMIAISASAQSPAAYPGGEASLQEYVSENLTYPATAKANGIEGIVTLEVTILPDGTVGPIKIKTLIDPDLEQEAIRLAKSMPAWTPATDASGRAVASTVTIPVTFSLGD